MAPPRKASAEPKPEAPESASDEAAKEEVLTVFQALSAVMGDVQSVSKTGRNTSQNYNFRGIDAVVNAVGPALREHGVIVVPVNVEADTEHYATKTGTAMKNVSLTITFRFYGPAGDHIDAVARGEAADSGDKATPKAHSVALRTALLQALCIPTDEIDPDAQSHERAAQPFQGSTGSEARPREQRHAAKPAYNWPKDWKELGSRMAALLGAEEAPVWIAQAVEVDVGEPVAVADLDAEAKQHVWGTLTKVLRSLDDELKVDPGAMPPPTREEIQGEFAKHLDGMILAGPMWALSGTEAEEGHPSKASVLDGAPDRTDPGADLVEESRGPTAEEIAEGQASLDEAAAEAARASD